MKIKINNRLFVNFETITIDSNIDSIASTFSFNSFFDENNQDHLEIFRPLSYNKVEIFDDDGSLMLTGVVVNHDFNAKSTSESTPLSGYSLPGVLDDCNIPYSSYPLESLKMNLREIIEKVIKPFNLSLVVDKSVSKEMGLNYPKSVCEPEDSIKDYISKLASQRNVILSHTKEGHLLAFRPDTKSTSKILFKEENTNEMTLSVNGQQMHSQMTVLRQPKMKKEKTQKTKTQSTPAQYDENGYEIEPPKKETKTVKEKPKSQFYDTIKNPMVNSFRPSVKKMTEGEDLSTKDVVKNLISDELRNISFSISIDRWESVFIGDIIEVESKKLFLKEKTRLIVESTNRTADSSSKKMTINAVLPEAFTGEELNKNIFL